MNKTIVSIVVAISEKNRVIGRDNKLPWHIPTDLKRFKQLTSGHPIIMGRKTYESIGRPLPNRTNIIITRDSNYKMDGCLVAHSLEEAIKEAKEIDTNEVFIIGGGEIFKQALHYTDKLYLTLVKDDVQGDVFFPDYSEFKTVLAESSHTENGFTYSFVDLVR